jgi:hypothetical protein
MWLQELDELHEDGGLLKASAVGEAAYLPQPSASFRGFPATFRSRGSCGVLHEGKKIT